MHTRRNFPNPVKREAWERSAGICECHLVWQLPTYKTGCGLRLGPGNTFYEHINPDKLGGLNDVDNCAVLVKTCWKLKTSGYDRPKIDKSRRQSDRARNIKSQNYRPIVGTKRSGIKLPMRFGAKPIDRRTGEPWGRR